jgi:hypothetical protein
MDTYDPEKLRLDKDDDWVEMITATPDLTFTQDEAGMVAACRAWYDFKKYEEGFCCQGTLEKTADKITDNTA